MRRTRENDTLSSYRCICCLLLPNREVQCCCVQDQDHHAHDEDEMEETRHAAQRMMMMLTLEKLLLWTRMLRVPHACIVAAMYVYASDVPLQPQPSLHVLPSPSS